MHGEMFTNAEAAANAEATPVVRIAASNPYEKCQVMTAGELGLL
jgi:hypothetical protein